MTRSTPRSSDSGNIMPASTTIISSPTRSTIMFIPNSPRPPRGITVRDCVLLLKERLSPLCDLQSYHSVAASVLNLVGGRARGVRSHSLSMRGFRRDGIRRERRLRSAAAEKMDDGDENYRADGGGSQAVQETAAEDAELHEEPAAEDRADQAEDNVG